MSGGDAATLMVVGTCSSAGKSTLVAALCRIFARRGLRVAPFKSQNMSLNSAVTPEGDEIGRSTYSQAEAARTAPHVDMNPVLLKPEGERRSQVILSGRLHGRIDAAHWQSAKPEFWRAIQQALARLRRRFDLVILEGAGSPAEINLPHDIANLRVARHAGARALLVGDIDRGGVFASLAGTMLLLPPEERAAIGGFVINKMRGDVGLLGDGPEQLARHAFGVPTLGVLPFLPELGLPEEDSLGLDSLPHGGPAGDGELDLAVTRLPRLSNFDDFDALAAEPGVRVRTVSRAGHLLDHPAPAALFLPGSKNTLADLEWLRASGLADAALELANRPEPTAVIGLCGGYQMLGESLEDPGHESARAARAEGLGLLPLATRFAARKTTRQVRGRWRSGLPGSLGALGELEVEGYEIHLGETQLGEPRGGETRGGRAILSLGADRHPDGCCDPRGAVWGTYVHGLFTRDAFRHAFLRGLGWRESGRSHDRVAAFDRLADHVEKHLDLDAVKGLIWPGGAPC